MLTRLLKYFYKLAQEYHTNKNCCLQINFINIGVNFITHFIQSNFYQMTKHLAIERQFQALISENQILRTKVKKFKEIQNYANILMQSTQSLQQELTQYNSQNKQLQNRIDKLMSEKNILQKDFKDLQAEFKRQLIKKDQEIRVLILNREKNKNILEKTLAEEQNRSKNDIQRLGLQLYQIKTQYEAQIKKLVSNLNQKNKDFEQNQTLKNNIKKDYLREINDISLQINKIRKSYQECQNKNCFLVEEIEKLSKLLQQMNNVQILTKKQLIKKQESFKEERKSLEKQIRVFQENFNASSANEKKLQLKNRQLVGQNQKLMKDYNLLAQKINELNIELKRLERLLNQRDEEIKQLKLKNQYQEEEYKRNMKRHSEHLQRVEQQLNLANEKFASQKRNSDAMKLQIADLLTVVDKLQQNLSQNEHKLLTLSKENSALFHEVQKLNKDLNSRNLQLSDLEQMYRKTNQNKLLFEEMLRKQKAKFQLLEKQSNQIIDAFQELKKKKETLKQQQISNIVEKTLTQKRQLLQNNRLQKEALIRKYEFALKEKDETAKNRLLQLGDEIALIRLKH